MDFDALLRRFEHARNNRGAWDDMFQQIAAVGADTYNMGTKTIGSVLIERMKVAGH